MYVVRMNGEKVRMFEDLMKAKLWAKKHCEGKVEIMALVDCGRLPRAEKKRFNVNFDLRRKPFVSLN